MTKFKNYKELKIWQKGIEIVLGTYELTSLFPKEEKFGLTSQMRRCAISIPSNIAEGWGRDSKKSFINFLKIARASLLELETQFYIAKLLLLIEDNKEKSMMSLITEQSKMINGFINKIKD